MKPENLWDSALDLAASTIELYDDATMKGDYMLDASECAAIIRALKSMRLHRDAQPAVAVDERVGVIERYGYQALFNAIAEATKIEGGQIGVSVIAFAKSLNAAIAAAKKIKGGV